MVATAVAASVTAISLVPMKTLMLLHSCLMMLLPSLLVDSDYVAID